LRKNRNKIINTLSVNIVPTWCRLACSGCSASQVKLLQMASVFLKEEKFTTKFVRQKSC